MCGKINRTLIYPIQIQEYGDCKKELVLAGILLVYSYIGGNHSMKWPHSPQAMELDDLNTHGHKSDSAAAEPECLNLGHVVHRNATYCICFNVPYTRECGDEINAKD